MLPVPVDRPERQRAYTTSTPEASISRLRIGPAMGGFHRLAPLGAARYRVVRCGTGEVGMEKENGHPERVRRQIVIDVPDWLPDVMADGVTMDTSRLPESVADAFRVEAQRLARAWLDANPPTELGHGALEHPTTLLVQDRRKFLDAVFVVIAQQKPIERAREDIRTFQTALEARGRGNEELLIDWCENHRLVDSWVPHAMSEWLAEKATARNLPDSVYLFGAGEMPAPQLPRRLPSAPVFDPVRMTRVDYEEKSKAYVEEVIACYKAVGWQEAHQVRKRKTERKTEDWHFLALAKRAIFQSSWNALKQEFDPNHETGTISTVRSAVKRLSKRIDLNLPQEAD